jgi:amino acid permease
MLHWPYGLLSCIPLLRSSLPRSSFRSQNVCSFHSLALPFALYQAGLVCGMFLLLISAWATSTSIGLLVEACDKNRLSTYEKIVEQVLGRRARNVVEISILVFCCGTAVGYVIAVGDIMERVIFMTPTQKRIAMSVIWLVAMLPLSCLRRMQSLQCASSVGIASIATLLVAAIAHLIRPLDDGVEDHKTTSISSLIDPAGGNWMSVVQACPIFFYAFSCQVNVAQIYEELPGPCGEEKIRKMGWVTWTAVVVCGLLYASVSIVTLLDFGDGVKPNILSCYDLGGTSILLYIAFLAMALAVVMAFPLNIFPARVSIIQMWEKNYHGEPFLCRADEEVKQPLLMKYNNGHPTIDYTSGEGTEGVEEAEDPLSLPTIVPWGSSISDGEDILDHDADESQDFPLLQHMSVTLLIAGVALGLALVVPNISVIFGLLGGTTSSLLGFIVPGLLGLKMDNKCVSAWVLVIAGSVIGVLTTGVTVYSTFQAIYR